MADNDTKHDSDTHEHGEHCNHDHEHGEHCDHDHEHGHEGGQAEDRKEQTVTVESAGPACKRLKIEVPQSRIQEKLEETYVKLSEEAVIPGFRRGRAPRRLVERRHGSTIRDDIKSQLISESFAQAVEDEKFNILGEPDVKDLENLVLPEDGPLVFEVEVEVTPDVTLPDFSKLEVTETSSDVTDEEVDAELNQLRERFGKMQEVTGEAAVTGDFLRASVRILEGENAGDDAEELLAVPEAYVLVPGESTEGKGHVAGIVVPDLATHVVGKTIGDVVRISLKGPGQHENEAIRDKQITLVITVNSMQRVQPADMERLHEAFGVESDDDVRLEIRNMLGSRKERAALEDVRGQVRKFLLDNVELELPERVTGRQAARVLQRRAMEMAYRGMSEQAIGDELAALRESSEEQAKEDLKLFFIIQKAADELAVEVTDREINGRVALIAQQQGRRPERIRQQMQKSGELSELAIYIREQKTLDEILLRAKNEAEEASPDKAEAAGSDAGDAPAAEEKNEASAE